MSKHKLFNYIYFNNYVEEECGMAQINAVPTWNYWLQSGGVESHYAIVRPFS